MEAGREDEHERVAETILRVLGDTKALELWNQFRDMSITNLKQVYQVNVEPCADELFDRLAAIQHLLRRISIGIAISATSPSGYRATSSTGLFSGAC